MAYIQRVTPPPNKVLNFSLKDFSGGMNNRSDQIKDNEGAVVKNLMFADDTVLETRYGTKYYNDIVYDGEIVFIDEYKPYRDDNMLVVATTEKMYIDTHEIPLLGKPSGVTHLGRYYFSDGETLKVFAKFEDTKEGENPITQKEEKPPEDVEAVDYHKSIGTPLTGYHIYDVVSPPDGHTRLSKEHLRGVTVIDYTKKEVYYEPCENEFIDPLNGACVVPESVRYVVSHDARLFVAGHKEDDDNVFITDLQNPLYFPVYLPIQIPPSSDKIMGIHVFDDSLVVGREKDIYVILGSTNRPNLGVDAFRLRRLNTHTGFASHSSVDIAHNYLIFLGSDGNVYGMNSTRMTERDLSTTILSRSIDLEKYPIEIDKEEYKNASSAFFNDEWHLSIGDKVMVYNYRRMAWTMYTQLEARCFYGIGSEWIWGRPDGRIAMFDKESFFDLGLPYESLWYSKIFDMDEPNSFKQFREFFLVAHTYGVEYSDIYVTFEVDYAEMRDRAVISNQISVWGKAVFGDRFISKNINESIPFVIGRRGRNIRFKITNGYELDGVVEDYSDLENYPGKRDGILVRLSTGENYLYMKREWILLEEEELNQRMKVYQINGDYEMRGKR